MPSPRAVLLAVAVVFALANISVTIHRSLIPVALDGEVTRVEVRREKHPGIDDVWLLHLGARQVHTDATVARTVPQGATIAKPAWSSRLLVDDRALDLRLSSDAQAMLWVMPLTLAVFAAGGVAARRLRG